MIEEFVNTCFETFPQITPESKQKVTDLLKQYRESGKTTDLFSQYRFDHINQGDIFSEVKWLTYDNDGSRIERRNKCFLLSTTCDAVRKDSLVFAAVRPIDEALEGFSSERIQQAKNNSLTQFMYLPGDCVDEYIVDFNSVFSIPRKLFEMLLENKHVKRETTLSNEGMYLFIAKFTLAYMRWQDPEVYKNRG